MQITAATENALDRYRNGDMTLAALGDVLIDEGMTPREAREALSEESKYPIPPGYFGRE